MAISAITTKNFKSQLNSFVTASSSQRDKLQALVVFGMEHAASDAQDTCYLTMAMRAVVGVRSMRTETLKNYIKACINVSWSKTTDGSMVFKKLGGDKLVYTPVDHAWYEQDKIGDVKPDLNVAARAKMLMTVLANGLKDGKVKAEEKELALKLQEAMSAVLNA